MARVLCAWEFGGGLGHVRRLAPIARELRDAGHQVSFAFRDVPLLERPLAEGFEVLAAPLLRPRARFDPSPLNHSDILLNHGYGDVPGLRSALRAWRCLLEALAPHVVVSDYAPTAALAARAAAIPCVTVGSGFALPAAGDPLPALRPWLGIDSQRLQALDEQLVGAIGEAMDGAPAAPRRASELFEARLHLLCTFAEIDPLGERAGVEYLGPIGDDDAGSEVDWASEGRPRIFAYLKRADSRLAATLAALDRIAGEAIVAVPGLDPRNVHGLASGRVRLIPGAARLGGLLQGADLCVSHGGPGIAAHALAAGVPLALLPLQLEHLLIAQRLEALGVGEAFGADRPADQIGPWIAQLLARASLGAAARDRARCYRDFPFAQAAARAAARIAAVAGN